MRCRRVRGFRAADPAIGTGSPSARACGRDRSPGASPQRGRRSIANLRAPIWRAIEELRREFESRAEPDLVALLRLPGVVAAPGAASAAASASTKRNWSSSERDSAVAWRRPLGKLDEMRRERGPLADPRDAASCCRALERRRRAWKLFRERSRPAYAQRLKVRFEELLGRCPSIPSRLAQEAALLAERADVSEELARLRSHVEQFDRLLDGAGEPGKKLDFLLQEMQREANTLLSKTPGLGAGRPGNDGSGVANESGYRETAGTGAERRIEMTGSIL